ALVGHLRGLASLGERWIVGEVDIGPRDEILDGLTFGIDRAALVEAQVTDGVRRVVAALDRRWRGRVLADQRVEDLVGAAGGLAPDAEVTRDGFADQEICFGI